MAITAGKALDKFHKELYNVPRGTMPGFASRHSAGKEVMVLDAYMTIPKAAEKYGISEKKIRKLVKDDLCPGFYAGSRFIVNADMLELLLKKMSYPKNRG